MTMAYLNQLLSNGSNSVSLTKEGVEYIGVWNGLSYWGKVFSSDGSQIEQLENDYDYGDDYTPNFSVTDFYRHGYQKAPRI